MIYLLYKGNTIAIFENYNKMIDSLDEFIKANGNGESPSNASYTCSKFNNVIIIAFREKRYYFRWRNINPFFNEVFFNTIDKSNNESV